jgi:hypothetical protein
MLAGADAAGADPNVAQAAYAKMYAGDTSGKYYGNGGGDMMGGDCNNGRCGGHHGNGIHSFGDRLGNRRAMPQSCYDPKYGCYGNNDRHFQRYPAFHGTYYRRPYNYRNLFDYPWHADLHEPTSLFSYNVPNEPRGYGPNGVGPGGYGPDGSPIQKGGPEQKGPEQKGDLKAQPPAPIPSDEVKAESTRRTETATPPAQSILR